MKSRCLLFDWGNTLMRVFPEFKGPMADWPQVEAVPGIKETLSRLRKEWMPVLATNAADSGEGEIRSALKRVGLNSFIDRVYCRQKIGHGKPSPEFFEYILNDLKIKRSDMVMIGDDFERDAGGAVRNGIRAIWFNEKDGQNKGSTMVRTIHHMRDLPEALDLLMRNTSTKQCLG